MLTCQKTYPEMKQCKTYWINPEGDRSIIQSQYNKELQSTQNLQRFSRKIKNIYTFKFELKLATNERAVYDKPDQSDLP